MELVIDFKSETMIVPIGIHSMPLEEARFFAQVKRHWHLAHIKSAQVYMNKAFWNDLGFQGLEWHMEHIAN
jgi:hypothetical protein